MEAGLENPVQCHYISSILRGTRRVLGQGVKSKLPITPRILADIFTMLDFSTSLDVVFWAVCLVAFFTFFRKSNLLAPSPACFDPERHLSRHHISFSEGGAVIQVNWSKTIYSLAKGCCAFLCQSYPTACSVAVAQTVWHIESGCLCFSVSVGDGRGWPNLLCLLSVPTRLPRPVGSRCH